MRIVAEFDISSDEIELSDWNTPLQLEILGREDEPFEDVEDLLVAIAEGLDSGNVEVEVLTDDLNSIVTWSVQE